MRRIVYTADGNFVATTGTGEDTEIQIFDASKYNHIQTIDTSSVNFLFT